MSGHSKWSTIKRQKGAADAKRGQLFTKLAREISIAARQGLPDPDANTRLRLAVDKAKAANMPKDNIERAIQRAAGAGMGDQYEEIFYEGYGPGGAALIIETLTDNRNRTVGELRHMLTKWGGNLGEANSVAWMFEKKSVITVAKAKAGEDALMSAVLDAGADDMTDEGATWEIVSPVESHQAVLEAVKALGIEPDSAEVSMVPKNYVKLEGKQAQQMLKLMDVLDDHDDTKNVWSNFDVEEQEIEASLA